MKLFLVFSTFICTLIFAGCNDKQPLNANETQALSAEENKITIVKIGHVAPLTGPIAHIGKDNENGVKLALLDMNAKNIKINGQRVKFELMAEDDQADEKLAVIAAQKLVDAKVAGVIGHLNSGATIAASKIYANAGIPQITGSATNPQYTHQGFPTAFRLIANDIQQGKFLGNFIANSLQTKRVAIIDDGTSYGKGLADEVNKTISATNTKIVARETTTDKTSDFKPILKKIKLKNPEVIFHGGLETTGAPMLKQMRAMGIKAQFMQGDGGCTPQFVRATTDLADGFICTHPGLAIENMPSAEAKRFKDRFEKKFGQLQIYAPYTYDATMVMIKAMQLANSFDPAKYLPQLRNITYEGLTGKIQFDDHGDIKDGYVTLYEVQCGKLDILFSQSIADLDIK